MTHSESSVFDIIRQRLALVRRKTSLLRIGSGLLFWLATILVIVFAASAVEAFVWLDVIPRTIIFWMCLSLLLFVLVMVVVRPVLRLFGVMRAETDEETARHVGNAIPSINDHLVNILQLIRDRRYDGIYSRDLISASLHDVYEEILPHDFLSAVDMKPLYRRGRQFLSALVPAVGLFLLLPALPDALARIVHYRTAYVIELPFSLVVEPGDKEVIKGEDVTIHIRVDGERQETVSLHIKPDGQDNFEKIPLLLEGTTAFTHTLNHMRETVDYYASAGEIQSPRYKLSVQDRPVVRMLRLTLDFPRYARLSKRQQDDHLGDVSALRGTRISFQVESSKNLASAKLNLSDKSDVPLDVEGKKAIGSIVLQKETTYHIHLVDDQGLTNADPIEYSLNIIPDAYPTVTILLPGQDLDVVDNQSLNMLIKISDDYGFHSLRLASRLIQSRYEIPAKEYSFREIPFQQETKSEMIVPYLWDMKQLSLVPEDAVSYFVEVVDNDDVSGPKSSRSESFILRLPSLDEVFAQVDRNHDDNLESLKETLKEAQEAKKTLDELHREMKTNQDKSDWQEQKKAEELVDKYEEIKQKLDEAQSKVDKLVNEMQKNNLLSQETLEKYQELQQLMQELSSPEFAEAMKQLQEAMLQLSPEAMRQAMQNFQFSEENFRKGIERTMDLLKRIQIEQKLDEAVKRMEEMVKNQEALQHQSEEANPSDENQLQDIAERQEKLRDKLDRMAEEMSDLKKKMEEFPSEMPLQEMEQALDSMEDGDLQRQMSEIAEMIRQQQMQKASKGQQDAMQKMGEMLSQIQQVQQSLRENQQKQIVNEMRRSLQDLLSLSRRQEELKNESGSLDPNSQRFRENAREQMQMMRDLGDVTQRLAKVAQKSFGVTPEMGKSIGDAMKSMSDAMQSLDQRSGQRASQQQGDAMASLNAAATQVQSAMNAMMQGGNSPGMGMMSFMRRMQQLSQQQQGLNEGTRNMGGLTPQQAADMGRLAGEQGVIRKSLEQLSREASNSGQLSKMLGDLRSIAREMREVQTDLTQGNVNPETLRKQDRILSRLLDSQRSARERDFEQKRKAEAGRDVRGESPSPIDLSTQEGRNKLRLDLLKAVEEGYAKDYETLIRKYFESLELYEPQAR